MGSRGDFNLSSVLPSPFLVETITLEGDRLQEGSPHTKMAASAQGSSQSPCGGDRSPIQSCTGLFYQEAVLVLVLAGTHSGKHGLGLPSGHPADVKGLRDEV